MAQFLALDFCASLAKKIASVTLMNGVNKWWHGEINNKHNR
jgi:hypothetical protein